jgi:penicillin-binding protein-related factor A (putative recombinase)
MVTAANRGKVAESKLQSAFKVMDAASSDFAFERIPDAHSSRGAMSSPRSGDFALYYKGANYLLEVKEVAHDYRLPKTNFGNDQKARMRKRQLAGTICKVLVYHSTSNLWRLLPLDYFDLGTTGSWDLSEVPATDLKGLLKVLL